MFTAAALAIFPSLALAEDDDCLQNVGLGEGRWKQGSGRKVDTISSVAPTTFATYATRFLIRYDKSVAFWWEESVRSYSLLSEKDRQNKLGRSFGSLATSLLVSLDKFLQGSGSIQQRATLLANLFMEKYGNENDARRHIRILFSLLPPEYQPTNNVFGKQQLDSPIVGNQELDSSYFSDDFTALLPSNYQSLYDEATKSWSVNPALSLFEVGIDDEFGQSAVATFFGPIASSPLTRQRPEYPLDVYALFGISGAAGCALTHTVVIPLDVVKTRMQTEPGQYDSVVDGAVQIVRREGPEALLLGAQATVAGYLWYGLSVYPSYTFFKRLIGQSVLPPDIATLHANDVALIAGAIAAVIASLGLTPLEACRIRCVADPDKYRPMGLFGTIDAISREDLEMGWKTLYAGLPSLLTRQVIFGSVKFLAFERACEAIFKFFPVLRDATWTALMVSLVAGGLSGALSSVVSQPADSVLTYVAQKEGESSTLGVIEGSRIMIEEEGLGSLFRGVGSRCVWAGSIIAGQFLLYDVFRTYFGVNGDDLSQVFELVISGSGTS